MALGLGDALTFAAVLSIRDYQQEKRKRLFKVQSFYQDCYNEISSQATKAFEIVSASVERASKCYMPDEILKGSTYLPLYAFGHVLTQQGRATPEQKKLLSIFFNNFSSLQFSQAEYVQSMCGGSPLKEFYDVIEVTQQKVGKFWLTFFRALYKCGTQKELQDVVDCFTTMVIRFSKLGNLDSKVAMPICERFISAVNYQITACLEAPPDFVDWLSAVPITTHIENLKEIYNGLVRDSEIRDSIDNDSLELMFNGVLLSSVCDFVLLSKQAANIKLKMADEALRLTERQYTVDAEAFILSKANNTGEGIEWTKIYSCSKQHLGTFWSVLQIMSVQANRESDCSNFLTILFSILVGIENHLCQQFEFSGFDHTAKQYMLHLLEMLQLHNA